jgi:hypothetical protein
VLTANSDFKIKDFARHSERRSTATSEFGSHSAVPQMLPRTDEDFDVALDEFDRIFRRIPPPPWAHHEWAVESSDPRASNSLRLAALANGERL